MSGQTALHPSGQPVQTVQRMLRDLSIDGEPIPRVIPDGVFTKDTKQAVQAFQHSRGLPVTGDVDHETWDHLTRAWKPARERLNPPKPLEMVLPRGEPLRLGSVNRNLPVIQAMLNTLRAYWHDMPPLAVTGVMDKPTVQAVCYIQERCNLPVTGSIDNAFWNVLAPSYRLVVGDGQP